MTPRKKRSILLIIVVLLASLSALALYAPAYLRYADSPTKADSIILFLGPDFPARQKEAHRLIAEGYANHLIIPAYGKIYRKSDQGILVPLDRVPAEKPSLASGKRNKNYPRHFEDTHVELIQAKSMLDVFGFKSSLLVSSPYHMRRIRLIARRVLNPDVYRLSFVPTRYKNTSSDGWWTNKFNLKRISGEYLKIAWFSLYSLFL